MKLFTVSLGCDKNLVDSEHMIAIMCDNGYEITDDENEADVIVINTCCFIHDAKQESIDTILEMARLKDNKLKALVVCGCLAARYESEIKKEIPEVDACLPALEWEKIEETVAGVLSDKEKKDTVKGKRRVISTPGHYEYLKIAEGCNRCCSYCIIPKMRGPYRSVPMEELLEEARYLADEGVKELILVAQETTLYGTDLYGKKMLPELLCKLSEIDGIRWIRLLYAYPEEITEELAHVMSTHPKICRYIDMPIQSGCDSVLKRMGRHTDSEGIKKTVRMLREKMPDICIRTTFITGFPGESQKDFEETYRFINEMEFDRLGVFVFSPEEGTKAYGFDGRVSAKTAKKRSDELYELQQAIAFEAAEDMKGKELTVMIDGYLPDDDVYVGRSYKDAPDIDGLVFVEAKRQLMTGDMIKVRVTGAKGYDLEGEMTDESSE